MRSRIFKSGIRASYSHLTSIPHPSPWICTSCRATRSLNSRAFSSVPFQETTKPYYVTSPIFYVNAAPHVGHLYTLILTDILKRWQVLKGNKAILCTGTDEHGLKVQQAAAKAGVDPKTFCDKGAEVFQELARRAEITNDHFVRTTDPEHKEAVEYAWHILQQKGYIYERKHEGWYSVSDEAFYPASAVHLVLDPATGRKLMASIETGSEVEWMSEMNYHFKLSAFRQPLLEFYKANPEWIVPEHRMKDVVSAVESGLEDLSISRPTERLTWGIRIPGDESQTMYVWLDALMNYATKAGYPFRPGKEHEGGWPADCQVIGKDIVRFHCIYWPAFLMALGVPLPKQILTHGHWTLGGHKMSKSTGRVVNPFYALDRFGPDVMRFCLSHDGGIASDASYDNAMIIQRYEKFLNGVFGNLTARLLRYKQWSVQEAVQRQGDIVPKGPGEIFYGSLKRFPGTVQEALDRSDVTRAIRIIRDFIFSTNQYFHNEEPWAKNIHFSQTDPGPDTDRIVYLTAEALRITGILLQPYMPNKAAMLLDQLGVDESRRTFEWAQLGRDREYGVPKIPLGRKFEGVLFPPLSSAE